MARKNIKLEHVKITSITVSHSSCSIFGIGDDNIVYEWNVFDVRWEVYEN